MRYQNPHMNQAMNQQRFPQQQPTMQQFPQQMHPGMQQMHPGMMQQQFNPNFQGQGMQQFPQQFPQQMHPGMMQQFTQQMHPNMMQQFQQMQANMQQQYVSQGNNQAVSSAQRFTESPHASNNMVQDTSRYETEEPKEQQKEDFVVNQQDIKVPYAKTLDKKVVTNKVTEADLHIAETSISVGSMEEVVEALFDVVNDNKLEHKLVFNNFVLFKTVYNDTIVEHAQDLFLLNIKDLYKQLKRFYIELNSLSDLVVLDTVNKTLTDRLNEFIATRISTDISVDSFAHDFNDLMKFIRTNFEDSEDDVITSMDNLVDEISSLINGFKDNNPYVLPELVSMVRVDLHSLELGLKNLPDSFVKVKESIANNFLLSVGRLVKEKADTDNFFLVTIDKKLIKFALNEDNEVFIRLV